MARRLSTALLAGLVLALVPLLPAAAVERLAGPAIAQYVDVCSDAPSSVDLRRLVFGPADADRYGIVAEGCATGSPTDWDVLVTFDGSSSPDRRIRVRTTAGVSTATVIDERTGETVHATTGVRRASDGFIQVLVPASTLAPIGSTLTLRLQAEGGGSRDSLPDAGRPAVTFPNPCAGGAGTAGMVLHAEPGRADAVAAMARNLGARVGTVDATVGIVEIGDADPAALVRLRRLDGVAGSEPNRLFERTAVTVNDPYASQQWSLSTIGAPTAWDTRTGSGLKVAVIDDGVDGSRSDLSRRVGTGRDILTGQNLPAGANSDLGGHGTSVAGILAAAGNDGVGMAGIDWTATVLPYRVFDEQGCASSAAVAAGIVAAADAGAKVINLSLGGPADSQVLRDAISHATGKGALLVAAAGNAGPGSPAMYPAANPNVVAVGATTAEDGAAPYSSTGSHLEISAPGGTSSNGILTLAERGGYAARAGTSFAAPMVSAAAALYLAGNPSATPDAVRSALARATVDLGPIGRDDTFGYGRLDLAALLAVPAPDSSRDSQTVPPADEPTSDETTELCAGAEEHSFRDLTGGVHDENIGCLVARGVTSGLDEHHYGPTRQVNRAQMATFLARLVGSAGASLPSNAPDAFTDDDGLSHEVNINALAAVGIVSGVSATEFAPGADVTRAQMATFLARTYAYVGGETLPAGRDAFTDDNGTAHEDSINRVAAAGIASGRGDGTFAPGAVVRRDQMASFLVGLARVLHDNA